ncbi:DUF998 domain-containing protein [Nocardioides campestrisoli]|uniref:DUF998 domain-containing protein n=1 Tax=Nocardioides campestrisoli TaxID=2736757 RepID=UPI0015E7AC77|nr:DUF998 domain-containing protein [Nocardioides campestrisoli]
MRRPGRRRLLRLAGVLAGVLYSGFALDWVLRGFEGMTHVVSELAAVGEPHAVLLRSADGACAVLVLLVLPEAGAALPEGRWRRGMVWGTATFALGAAAAAVVTAPCGPGVVCDAPGQRRQAAVHDAITVASDLGLFVGVAAAWAATRREGPAWLHRTSGWVLAVPGVAASVVFGAVTAGHGPGWASGGAQRVHIVGISVWLVCLGLLAGRETGDQDVTWRSPHREGRPG